MAGQVQQLQAEPVRLTAQQRRVLADMEVVPAQAMIGAKWPAVWRELLVLSMIYLVQPKPSTLTKPGGPWFLVPTEAGRAYLAETARKAAA